jgi:hypothetical protein
VIGANSNHKHVCASPTRTSCYLTTAVKTGCSGFTRDGQADDDTCGPISADSQTGNHKHVCSSPTRTSCYLTTVVKTGYSAFSKMTTPIPQPPSIPIIGNILDIDTNFPIGSFQLLAAKYGKIFQLNFLGMFVLSYQPLVSLTLYRLFRKNRCLCYYLCSRQRAF